jgi:hypothetical protein
LDLERVYDRSDRRAASRALTVEAPQEEIDELPRRVRATR